MMQHAYTTKIVYFLCTIYYLFYILHHIFRTNEENIKRQQSQELSDLAAQVLDFCNDTTDPQPAQLTDLSDLLAHYDTIKQQQQDLQRPRTQVTNGYPLFPHPNNGREIHTEISAQLPSDRATRKPLIRPALPVLAVSKERLPDWNGDTSKSTMLSRDRNERHGKMADSGIDVDGSSQNADSNASKRQSSSDGYSSESEDSVNTIASPASVIANPMTR